MARKKKSEGLGDTVEKITKATGIKKAVELFTNGKDCGCSKRKEQLNELFRYKADCLVESEYNWLTEYFKRHNEKKFTKEDVYRIAQIHRRVFNVRTRLCSNCNSAVVRLNEMVEQLKNVHSTYKTK